MAQGEAGRTTLDDVRRAVLAAGAVGDTGDEIDAHGVHAGRGRTRAGTEIGIVGIAGGKPVGIEAALALAGHVLAHAARGDGAPLLVLVDSQSQAMRRRDELLGLNEYLAHLTKSLVLASRAGHRTVGLLYGAAAAGAFIATALATDRLVALRCAAPSVMDLASIARITKLPEQRLEEMARSTPIFAPGVGPLAAAGAIAEIWDDPAGYGDALDALLAGIDDAADRRDALGAERGGRAKAEAVASRVMRELAAASG